MVLELLLCHLSQRLSWLDNDNDYEGHVHRGYDNDDYYLVPLCETCPLNNNHEVKKE